MPTSGHAIQISFQDPIAQLEVPEVLVQSLLLHSDALRKLPEAFIFQSFSKEGCGLVFSQPAPMLLVLEVARCLDGTITSARLEDLSLQPLLTMNRTGFRIYVPLDGPPDEVAAA